MLLCIMRGSSFSMPDSGEGGGEKGREGRSWKRQQNCSLSGYPSKQSSPAVYFLTPPLCSLQSLAQYISLCTVHLGSCYNADSDSSSLSGTCVPNKPQVMPALLLC